MDGTQNSGERPRPNDPEPSERPSPTLLNDIPKSYWKVSDDEARFEVYNDEGVARWVRDTLRGITRRAAAKLTGIGQKDTFRLRADPAPYVSITWCSS